MSSDILSDSEFQRLEKEFPFLRRARKSISPDAMDLNHLTFTIVDIETTGLEPTKHEIIEIGAIKLLPTKGIEKFQELISPIGDVPEEIEKFTGITRDMLIGKPSIVDVLPKFLEFIEDSILVAHNAEFDLSFLKHYTYKALNKEINNHNLCTVRLSRVLLPHLENHKLHTLASYFHINVENRHRAMGDAELTLQSWLKIMEILKQKNVNNLHDIAKLLESVVPF
ncbi:MAG: exonuclease domain-containing protein [bacterium]